MKKILNGFVTLLVLMAVSSCAGSSRAVSSNSYAQDNVSLLSVGTLYTPAISVDGKKINRRTDVVVAFKNNFLKINPGERTITVGDGKRSGSTTFIFEPDRYYSIDIHSFLPKISFSFIDTTDLVLRGVGGTYDMFSEAEKRAGITRLSNGIGKVRAPNGKSNDNFGVHNYSPNHTDFTTIRIIASDGLLVVKEINGETVTWYGDNKGGVVVFPSGKKALTLNYLAPRPEFNFSGFAELGSRGVIELVVASISAIADAAKKAKADQRDTSNIKLNYEFFPGAEYEIRFVKSKLKNGPYAEVEIIPKKGYPRGQTRGRGAVPSYDDIKAAAAAEEAAKTAAAAAWEASKTQISYIVAVGGRQTGPYSYDELRQLASKGQLTKNTLVWKEGMPQWAAAGTVDELAGIWSSVPPPLPPPLP
jgi:hypothetical protein